MSRRCCFPATVIPAVLGFLGCWMASFAVSYCSFVVGHTSVDDGGPDVLFSLGYLTVRVADDVNDDQWWVAPGSCQTWSSQDKDVYFDGIWRFGKAMGLVATICGFLAFAASVVTCCFAVQQQTIPASSFTCFLSLLYPILAACSLSMLFGLESQMCSSADVLAEDCSLGPGATMAIVSSLMYLGAGISTMLLVDSSQVRRTDVAPMSGGGEIPVNVEMRETDADMVYVEESIHPDGTRVITRTITMPDGGQIIQRRIVSLVDGEEDPSLVCVEVQ